jgi:zinc protease
VSRKQLRSKQGGGIARLAILAAALVACVAPTAGATTIERVVSPGGIEAWLVHESAVPLIAVDFAFVGGAIQDPPGKAGTSVMAASLLDEGAGDLDSQAFHQRLERKAVELNFETERDAIRGSLRTLTENRDEAFDDLRLSLTAPRFDPAAVEIIRGQVLSLVRRAATNPADMARQRWWEIAFADHPYGRPANGTSESVPTITADDLKAYTRRVLARENLKVAVVGDIDAEAVKAMLDRVFGALPAKAELAAVASVSPQGLGRRIVIKRWSRSAAPGLRARTRISWPPTSSITFLAAARFPRGSIRRCARSAGLPIRSTTVWCGSITPHCFSAAPPRAPTTPGKPST